MSVPEWMTNTRSLRIQVFLDKWAAEPEARPSPRLWLDIPPPDLTLLSDPAAYRAAGGMDIGEKADHRVQFLVEGGTKEAQVLAQGRYLRVEGELWEVRSATAAAAWWSWYTRALERFRALNPPDR